jgi:hypothetical protein
MRRGLAGADCTSRLHVRRKSVLNHAISVKLRREIAVVASAKECGDGGDAMGWCRVCELRDRCSPAPTLSESYGALYHVTSANRSESTTG